ncbi:MAG: hypothetical protein ACR2HS_05760, partial [Gammaproteobacteria bacterium]
MEIIEKHPQFRTIKIEIFNKKASKKAEDIFKELQFGNILNLKKAYYSYFEKYEAILQELIPAFNISEMHSKTQSKKECESISQRMINEAKMIAKQLKEKQNFYLHPVETGKIIANICGTWTYLDAKSSGFGLTRTKLLQPHSAQVISVLLLLGMNLTQGSIANHLLQINTGEGKSVTIAISAITLSLLGYYVDVACYSVYLADRDARAFKELFKLFGELDEEISYKNFDDLIQQHVSTIGDTRELARQLLKEKVTGNTKKQENKSNKILFIDEVDVFFGGNFLGETLNPCIIIQDECFQKLLYYIWENKQSLLEDHKLAKSRIKQHDLIKQFVINYPNIKEFIDKSINEILVALKNVDYGNDHGYLEKNNGIGYPDSSRGGDINYNLFYRYNTVFKYIEKKEFFSQTFMKTKFNSNIGLILTTGSLSYAEIPKNYNLILGVTGTLSSLSPFEKSIIEGYGITKQTIIPSIFKKDKLKGEKDILVCGGEKDAEDDKSYFNVIKKEIEINVSKDRAVLIVFENHKRLDEFIDFTSSHKYKDLDGMRCNYLTEVTDDNNRDLYINSAAICSQITFLTRIFGRGSDFVCR